jgi:hypothetical protein
LGVVASTSFWSSLLGLARPFSDDKIDESGDVPSFTGGGSCIACVTASMSPRRRAGGGDCNRGGRGGAGELGLNAYIVLGGGGSESAVA